MKILLGSFVDKCSRLFFPNRENFDVWEKLGNLLFFFISVACFLHQIALHSTELVLNCSYTDINSKCFCICTGFNGLFWHYCSVTGLDLKEKNRRLLSVI